ncbi:hypothetical protein FACS1894186_6710 [Alphaproteobacteria bacterium]|nr:hypothetical protein FACS1894186_6710 [Alphaproteobacteria bacterium]
MRAPIDHSKIVRGLKVVFPAVAGLLALTIVVWPELAHRDSGDRFAVAAADQANIGETLALDKPVFRMFDTQAQSFVVRADSAREIAKGSQVIALEYPYADIALKKAVRVYVSARRGVLDQKAGTLGLTDSLRVQTSGGHDIRTARASVDFNAKTIEGDAPVQGKSAAGNVEADGFRILDKGDKVVLLGHSRAEVAAKKGAAQAAFGFGFASSSAPLVVVAEETMTWNRLESTLEAEGKAQATKGSSSLAARLITAKYDGQGRVRRLAARESVAVKSWQNQASGAAMDYDLAADLLVLTGAPAKISTGTETLTAARFEYKPARRLAVATGKARILRADGSSVAAERIEAVLAESGGSLALASAVATGDVVIAQGDEKAYGDRATYDAARGRAVLTGAVVLERKGSFLRGKRLVVDMDSGVSALESEGRIEGTFDPKGVKN